MILGPISYLDCVVFCIFLAPQLLWNVGIFRTLVVAIEALPFLILELPVHFIKERYFTDPSKQHAFVREATPFEDFVIRCVRYAFKSIDYRVGRVFFSKYVALPFFRWRLLRHGYLRFPAYWRECTLDEAGLGEAKGLWIMETPEIPPDFVLYYAHGGGFVMGSSYFYLEFLMTWHHLLKEAGFQNPAIFALEYSLVPDEVYPKQIHETLQGYKHVLATVRDASKVCVAGDSAGGALALSLLLELGAQNHNGDMKRAKAGVHEALTGPLTPALPPPGMCTLISPWVTLLTSLHDPSDSDYLDRRTLWKYALQYAGDNMVQQQPASPGNCVDDKLWKASSPTHGYFAIYGEDEVFAPDIEDFLKRQARIGIEAEGQRIEGGIHAWPVASVFLSNTPERRLHGLKSSVSEIRRRILKVGDSNNKK